MCFPPIQPVVDSQPRGADVLLSFQKRSDRSAQAKKATSKQIGPVNGLPIGDLSPHAVSLGHRDLSKEAAVQRAVDVESRAVSQSYFPPVIGLKILLYPKSVPKRVAITACREWGVCDELPPHLREAQIVRLIQNTQRLLDNSMRIKATVKELKQYLAIPSNSQKFERVLKQLNQIVWDKLVLDMHDEKKFLCPKTYHTEYHAMEMFQDLGRFYHTHLMGTFFASLALGHDLIQDIPPQYGTAISENEDLTAAFLCDFLSQKKDVLNIPKSCFYGMLFMAQGVIVHGTYLVNFAESEGLLMMRLLHACMARMPKDRDSLRSQIKALEPFFEAVAIMGLSDICRISFPEVIVKHQEMLVSGGHDRVLDMPVTDPKVAKMLYWASHCVRILGELATYRTINHDHIGSPIEILNQPSDFHRIFSDFRDAFQARNAARISALLCQEVIKVSKSHLCIEEKPFFMHIYDGLIADRSFIQNKKPIHMREAQAGLYPKTVVDDIDPDPYGDVIAIHDRLQQAVTLLEAPLQSHAIMSFVNTVMYGAVFQEGYRAFLSDPLQS